MLNKDISSRLRAGALVIVVEEADELLAVESAKLAAKAFQPVTVITAADQSLIEKLESHKAGSGTMIVCDFFSVYSTDPVAIRMVREIALQSKKDQDAGFARLIMLETPGVNLPATLASDVELLSPAVPSVKELRMELDDFVKQHDVKIKGNGETRHAIATSVAGLSRHEAARLFARSFIEKDKTLDQVWLRREKAARVAERLGGSLTFVETDDSPDVGGLDELKRWLKTRKNTFGSEAAKKYGLPEPKGILLLGIPGTGKSLSAKAVSQGWGLPLLRLDAGKLFGSLVGQSESQTRQAIQAAEAASPCILWIDEIEKGFAGAKGGNDSGTSQRVFGTLLTWLQEKTKPVFVVATANRIADLPPELLRKGRFDEIFFINLPDINERKEIITIHLVRHGRSPKRFKVADIARSTEGFSGAELEQAVIEAMFNAYAEEREFETKDILTAIEGTQPLSKTMAAEVDALKRWAEGRARKAQSVAAVKTTGQPRRSTLAK